MPMIVPRIMARMQAIQPGTPATIRTARRAAQTPAVAAAERSMSPSRQHDGDADGERADHGGLHEQEVEISRAQEGRLRQPEIDPDGDQGQQHRCERAESRFAQLPEALGERKACLTCSTWARPASSVQPAWRAASSSPVVMATTISSGVVSSTLNVATLPP